MIEGAIIDPQQAQRSMVRIALTKAQGCHIGNRVLQFKEFLFERIIDFLNAGTHRFFDTFHVNLENLKDQKHESLVTRSLTGTEDL